MIRFKIDVASALEEKGVNLYVAKTKKVLSQNTLNKVRTGSTEIKISSLDKLCAILNVQPGELLEYIPDEEIV